MNTEQNTDTFANSVRNALKEAQDKKTAKSDRLKAKKIAWFCDSVIISLFLSALLICLMTIAAGQKTDPNKTGWFILALAGGIGGAVYRLKDFDER